MAKKRVRKPTATSMVPIYSLKLRAALADQKSTVTELARKLKANPQTIAYLASGDGMKRSRASRRAQIEKVLNLTEGWLGEPTATLAPLWVAGVNVATASGVFFSPRTQLALSRLLDRCVAATDRDLHTKGLLDHGFKETATPTDVRAHVAACVRKLTDVDGERGDVLVGAEQPYWGVLIAGGGGIIRARHLPYDEDEEEAGINLISAWEQILEPWFSGKAKMNYRRLRERAGFPVPDGERRSDTNPHIIVWTKEKGAL